AGDQQVALGLLVLRGADLILGRARLREIEAHHVAADGRVELGLVDARARLGEAADAAVAGAVEDAGGRLVAGGDVPLGGLEEAERLRAVGDRKSTRLNSSHVAISYAVFCLKKKSNVVTLA